jgi:hypothetical protein
MCKKVSDKAANNITEKCSIEKVSVTQLCHNLNVVCVLKMIFMITLVLLARSWLTNLIDIMQAHHLTDFKGHSDEPLLQRM